MKIEEFLKSFLPLLLIILTLFSPLTTRMVLSSPMENLKSNQNDSGLESIITSSNASDLEIVTKFSGKIFSRPIEINIHEYVYLDWGPSDWGVNLFKIDESGTKIWNKTFHDSNRSEQEISIPGRIFYHDNESFIFLWFNLIHPNSDFEHWITRIHSNGSILWNQSFFLEYGSFLFSLQRSLDGGYLLLFSQGAVYSLGTPIIIKLDKFGDYEWNRSFYNIHNGFTPLLKLDGNNFAFVGNDSLIKIDSNGNVVSKVRLNYNKNHVVTPNDVIITQNQHLLVTISPSGWNNDLEYVDILLFDQNFDVLWNITYLKDKHLISIHEFGDNFLIESENELILINQNSNEEWKIVFNGYKYVNLHRNCDNSFILSGERINDGFIDVVKFRSLESNEFFSTCSTYSEFLKSIVYIDSISENISVGYPDLGVFLIGILGLMVISKRKYRKSL